MVSVGKWQGWISAFKKSLQHLAGRKDQRVGSGSWKQVAGSAGLVGWTSGEGGCWQRQSFHTCQIGSSQMLVKVEPLPLSSPVESEFPRAEKLVLEWVAQADFCHQIKLGDMDVSIEHFVRSYAEPMGMEKGLMEGNFGSSSRCWRYSCEQIGSHSRDGCRLWFGRLVYREHGGLQAGGLRRGKNSLEGNEQACRTTRPHPPPPPQFKIKTSPWCQFQHTGTAGKTSGISPVSGPAEHIFPCHLNGQLLKSPLCFNKRDLIKWLQPSPWWNNIVLARQKTCDNVLSKTAAPPPVGRRPRPPIPPPIPRFPSH